MVSRFLRPGQALGAVKYFTARISGPADKKSRQDAYLAALGSVPGVSVFEGHYLTKDFRCQACGRTNSVPTEKMTDVNIASEMLVDAFHDAFDTAFLVSGDSDLTPPVRHIRALFPRKSVVVLFPPRRVSDSLRSASQASLVIGESHLRHSQFPEVIQFPAGASVNRPALWH